MMVSHRGVQGENFTCFLGLFHVKTHTARNGLLGHTARAPLATALGERHHALWNHQRRSGQAGTCTVRPPSASAASRDPIPHRRERGSIARCRAPHPVHSKDGVRRGCTLLEIAPNRPQSTAEMVGIAALTPIELLRVRRGFPHYEHWCG